MSALGIQATIVAERHLRQGRRRREIRAAEEAARIEARRQLDRLRGSKGGGKGGGKVKSAVETGDKIYSKSTGRVVDIISGDLCAGLATPDDPLRSVKLDGVVVKNADGSVNHPGVTIDFRDGSSGQAHVPGNRQVESETLVNLEATHDSPVVITVDDANLDAIIAKVRIPALQVFDHSGDLYGYKVSYAFDLQPDGGSYSEVVTQTVNSKFGSPVEFPHRIELTGAAPWNIRFRRTIEDSDTERLQNETWFSTYTRVIDAKLTYEGWCYAFLTFDAELFGNNIPRRSYLMGDGAGNGGGVKVPVPANYDPITRVYATTGPGTTGGIWDGTFANKATQNPVWNLVYLFASRRFGIGVEVGIGAIEKFRLYAAAQYADQLIPDGKGGMEPRFTFNTQIMSKASAYAAIQSVASAFRGITFWGAGSVNVVHDAPEDPVRTVTNANVAGGEFDYQDVDDLELHSVVNVTWNDPENGFKPRVEAVERPDLIAQFGRRPTDIVDYGCTRRSQARRTGLMLMETEQSEGEVATWTSGFDQADVTPGQIVKLADSMIMGTNLRAGRIAAATLTSITLDREVTITPGEDTELAITMPDLTEQLRIVDNDPGAATVLTFADALPELPEIDAVWSLSSLSLEPRRFRVLDRPDSGKHQYDFTAQLHDPEKAGRVEQGFILTDHSFSSIPTGPIAAPLNISLTPYVYLAGGAPHTGLSIAWTAPDDARVLRYELEIERPGDSNYSIFQNQSAVTFNVLDIAEGAASVRIRSITGLGEKSAFTVKNQNVAFPRPADVGGLQFSKVGTLAKLNWPSNPEPNINSYEIRFSSDTATPVWENAIDLIPEAIGNSATLAAINGAFLIKAVNSYGKESLNARIAIADFGPIAGFNAIETLTEQPAWSGVKVDVAEIGGKLELDFSQSPRPATGSYTVTSLDYGAPYPARITVDLQLHGRNLNNVLATWGPLSTVGPLSGANPSQYATALEVRAIQSDPADSPALWGEWQPFVIGDYTGRQFQLRLNLFSLSAGVTPVIDVFATVVDVEDRVEKDDDVGCPAPAGVNIDYAYPFRIGPALQITLQDGDEGDKIVYTRKDETGFAFTIQNGGVAQPRSFDWTADGAGIKIT